MRHLMSMCFAAMLSTGACQETWPTVPQVTIEQIAADPAAYDHQQVRVKGKYRVLGEGPIPLCIPTNSGATTLSDQYQWRATYWVLDGTSARLGVMVFLNGSDQSDRYTLLNAQSGDEVELVGTVKDAPVEDPCRTGSFSKSAYLSIEHVENQTYFP
jgi:hypothetical protein